MNINTKKSFDGKQDRLTHIANQADHNDVILSLFFSGRNLSISNVLYQIETYLGKLGFDVRAEWKESSFGNPLIYIYYNNKNKHHQYSCELKRSKEGSWDSVRSSSIMYKLEKVTSTEYTPYQISAHILALQHALASQVFFDMVNGLVNACNYPFGDTTVSYDDKITALNALENGCGTDHLADLFEMNRKYSVYNLLREIKREFSCNGFKVIVHDPDLSTDTPFITVELLKPNATFDIKVHRIKVDEIPDGISPYMYKFGNACNMSSSNSKARHLADFQVYTLKSPFEDKMDELVNGLNYPFSYESQSSF
jgi:hypothetical protein